MKYLKFNVNVCDQTAKDIEIHLTQKCDNKCEFCIDRMNNGIGYTGKPVVTNICLSLAMLSHNAEILSIAGGEPCLYLDELLEIIKWCKQFAKHLKINLITSLPYNCYKNQDKFFEILELIDTMTISAQHYKKDVADKIRGTNTPTRYQRNEFYKSLPHKEKISITLNSVKGLLDNKQDIIDNILYFNELGFKHIKLCEIMKYDKLFVNLENILNIKLPEPFASGCNISYDINKVIHSVYPDKTYDGTFNLKRQCFYTTAHRHANIFSLIKVLFRKLFNKKYLFAVIYEDGSIHNYWQ